MNIVKNICKRIVGGDYVNDKGKYPFMASLWYLDGEEFRFKSGATYIGGRYFLTAAHCLKNRELERV